MAGTNLGRFTLLSIGDSIDAVIAQDEIRQKELWDWARHGKSPSWATQHEPSNQRAKPMIIARPEFGPSEEELQRMIQDVWDFAGGKQVKWKPIGRTPSGRKSEVLTFDGSEEVLVSATSVEIPTQEKDV